MKQGPFARAGLCCPDRHHYYDPLRLPLDHLPLPASGYRQACFPGPQPGAEEGLSSSQDNLLTIPRPLTPEGSSASAPGPKTPSVAFAHRQRARLPLVPHTTRRCAMTTLQASLHAADWPVATPSTGCCRSASTSRSRPISGASYRAPWRLPGPDSHRLAALSLSLGYVTTTSSLSWRPNCWTHCRSGASVSFSTSSLWTLFVARHRGASGGSGWMPARTCDEQLRPALLLLPVFRRGVAPPARTASLGRSRCSRLPSDRPRTERRS